MTPAEARAAAVQLRPRCVTWARSYGLDVDAAEDVAHDAVETLLRRAEVVERPAVTAWLRTTVLHKAREHRRGRREVLLPEPPEPAAAEPTTTEGTLVSAELSGAVREAMDRIAESRRTILAAVHLEGRTQADVAAELGVPESTVRARARDGLAELEADLHRQRVAERRRTGGHSSWSIMALAGWERVERRLRAAIGVRLAVALGAIIAGGAPLTSEDVETLRPTPEEIPVLVVAVEPLAQPVTAWAERGVERPVAVVRQRARHDVPAHMLRQRLTPQWSAR
ncbi:MAG: RNA polymerase sigma factor [Betaproteobacteria bacterium]|nr:RNA polymerase sigma factor [Betaproteobacteria bacterium]